MSDLVGNPEDRFSHVAAHFMPEIIFNGAIAIVKMSARDVTIFLEKSKIGYFSFKMHQTKTKLYCMHTGALNF